MPDQSTDLHQIRFKCRLCRQPLEAEVDMMGSEVECPNCKKMIRVPLHVFSINPFRRPIRKFVSDIAGIQWQLPYFPQVVEVAVLLFVLVVTTILYLTIGIASQVSGIFQNLMLDARHQIKTGSLVEKSAYAVAAGIYLLLWLPFWILLLPFTILGWLWKHLGYFGLIVAVVVGLAIYVATVHREWVRTTLSPFITPTPPVEATAPPSDGQR
jgi:hypothetical protein